MTADKPDAKPYSPFDRDDPRNKIVEISEADVRKMVTEAREENRVRDAQLTDPKQKARGKHILREIIKEAVKDSKLTEQAIRDSLKDRARRRIIAKKRGIEPGTRRWRALVRDTTKRRRKGK